MASSAVDVNNLIRALDITVAHNYASIVQENIALTRENNTLRAAVRQCAREAEHSLTGRTAMDVCIHKICQGGRANCRCEVIKLLFDHGGRSNTYLGAVKIHARCLKVLHEETATHPSTPGEKRRHEATQPNPSTPGEKRRRETPETHAAKRNCTS